MGDGAAVLAKFAAGLKNDIARPNRFITEIILNQRTKEGIGIIEVPKNLIFYNNKASIPKKDVSGPQIKYKGMSLTLAGDYKVEPIILSFWNDAKFEGRIFFEKWLEQQVDTSINKREFFIFNRLGNKLKLKQIGNSGDIIAEYEYEDIIPLEISEIDLDQSASDTLQEYTVTFHFSKWSKIP